MQRNNYYSHGKVLLTGEYLVLKGAYALALPLRLGQSLLISEGSEQGTIDWRTTICGKEWFNARFATGPFEIIDSTSRKQAEFISGILKAARKLNKYFLPADTAHLAEANLEFDINYGFGSSSTLITNIASWSKTDPFDLHRAVSRGSGYDIAAAQATKPIIFKRTELDISINPVNFKPPFSDKLFFGYLGNKKETETNVKAFLERIEITSDLIKRMNDTTLNVAAAKDIYEFIDLMAEHEAILAAVLGEAPVKERLFPEFNGIVKSLGAWGGDFALFVSAGLPEYTREYLHGKGISPVYNYNEIIL